MSACPVLIIEDDHDIRETCKQILELEGYQVSTAANGQQGLDFLRSVEVKPCVILLDLMMPVMNGWEFLKARSTEPAIRSVPVVVVTAAGQAGGPPPADIEGFLKKPIELDTLLKVVGRHCPAS